MNYRLVGSSKERAFSLVEMVLALGVISFALVGIMGLFPVAMKSAQESQQETRAAIIARQVFSDLTSVSGTTPRPIALGTNTDLISNWTSIPLTTSGSVTINYDLAGQPIGTSLSPNAIYRMDLVVSPNTPSANISQVQATVSVPAAAPVANRSSYGFVTLLRAN